MESNVKRKPTFSLTMLNNIKSVVQDSQPLQIVESNIIRPFARV